MSGKTEGLRLREFTKSLTSKNGTLENFSSSDTSLTPRTSAPGNTSRNSSINQPNVVICAGVTLLASAPLPSKKKRIEFAKLPTGIVPFFLGTSSSRGCTILSAPKEFEKICVGNPYVYGSAFTFASPNFLSLLTRHL